MTETNVELLIGLMVVAFPLVALARRVHVSYPIVLVLGGLALGFVPGLPQVQLDPNLVLLIFLPPLLYWEAVTAPTDVMLANPGQIGMLAIGLVFATTAIVWVVMHAVVPGMPWAVAFVLGAVVAPTDELASAPVLERLKMPRHLIAIVEGESLVNDALSLVLYAAAITAVVTGVVRVWHIVGFLFAAAIGAFVLGLVVGRIAVEGWRRVTDTQLQGVISLLLPFLAYAPAQRLGISGVLSVVTAGVYVNRFTPTVLTPSSRLQLIGFWETFVFIANALLFLLVGLQLHTIAANVFAHDSWPVVLWYALVVNAVVIVVRLAWFLGTEYMPVIGGSSEHPDGDWRHALIASWSGLRGAVSLAAALAIPLTTAAGAAFPHRDLIIFLTFSVIFVTLVGGGLTLPGLIAVLHVAEDDPEEAEDLRRALSEIARAALSRVDELARDDRIDAAHATALRKRYEHERLLSAKATGEGVPEAEQQHWDAEREVIDAQRRALIALRARGEIDNAILRRVLVSLDLAERRLQH
ncbi:MAG TPA: Na+/H+ antiporter [Candidatus Elarobacter sp.]|nr:Na+/H+ antiporter [Candidatus Elarobacter sp.]